MNQIFDLFEEGDHLEDFKKIIESLPSSQEAESEVKFRDMLFYTTRHLRKGRDIIEHQEKDDAVIEQREKTALSLIRLIEAKLHLLKKLQQDHHMNTITFEKGFASKT